MKPALLVNEKFPEPALQVLRKQGVDVISVRETMPGASDGVACVRIVSHTRELEAAIGPATPA